jgi:hypothetical protein
MDSLSHDVMRHILSSLAEHPSFQLAGRPLVTGAGGLDEAMLAAGPGRAVVCDKRRILEVVEWDQAADTLAPLTLTIPERAMALDWADLEVAP